MKITSIRQQVKIPDRYSVYVDEKFVFGISESGLLASKLVSGQEITPHELAALKKDAAVDKVYGNALRYSVMRVRSEWEMRAYLQRKEVDEPLADQIIERLYRNHLLDDTAFAQAWVANRRLLRSVSKRRLRQELHQKHVAEAIIDTVLQEDETDEKDVLQTLLERKRRQYPDNIKLMQYLARQGFGYDDIKRALERENQEQEEE